jgi:hypothetical protein
MKLSYLLPIASLIFGYYIAEGRDYTPPALPQGERYVSARLFGAPDVPAHAVIALMPSRAAMIGKRAIPSITVTKPSSRTVKRTTLPSIPDVGWHPWAEFAKLDQAAGRIDNPARGMSKRNMPEGCPIPKPIWEAIDSLSEGAYVKSIIAGAGWVESRWDVNAHHYDNDGGYSHGWLQLHGHWRKKDVTWMKARSGGWKCPKNNLQAFLRTIRDHEKYYPQTKGSWKLKLSHYNGGKKGNMSYANKCLDKAKELQRWFN